MAAIESIALPATADPAALAAAAAQAARKWLADRAVAECDAILLVPFAALLAPLRQVFAMGGGWLPRVETALTLADALGPPPLAAAGRCSGDPVLDRLTAMRLLRRQPRAVLGASVDDANDLHTLASLLASAAQALRAAAHAHVPDERPAYWARVREHLDRTGGPGATEATLLRLAVAWAARGTVAATDRLFELRPAAWIVLRLGGADALAQALLASATVPALQLDADPDPQAPFSAAAAAPAAARVRRLRCDDAEAEARAAATEVIEALNAGRVPVALVAVDRERVRRVRALLEQARVPLIDETGWRLATTRAAARIVALLRAAAPGAGRDAWLDWLATWPPAAADGRRALRALEALWRRRRRQADSAAGEALFEAARQHLAPLAAAMSLPLAEWLLRLRDRLGADGSLAQLAADAAGLQALQALRLVPEPSGALVGRAWQATAASLRLDLAGFTAWVEATLDDATFLPPPDPGAAVVVTPLARAIGRPFGHAVMPGADHEHLGAPRLPPALIGPALTAVMGAAGPAEQRLRQRLALAHLLRLPAVTLLRRRQEAGEGIADSPDLLWLLATRSRSALAPWPLEDAAGPRLEVGAAPCDEPRPQAMQHLPAALSATQLQALRDCPYRFFARAVLHLDEPAELDAALAKRDYGDWLHLVLMRFHAERGAPTGDGPGDDPARLAEAASRASAELELDEAELLPYRASFEVFAPAYLAWLTKREADGWQWQAGEFERRVAPPPLAPTELRGRIDRVDRGPDGARFVLDYKTGSASSFQDQVRDPLEDTQLAFYAALLLADGGDGGDGGGGVAGPVRAAYLALDGPDAPKLIEHEQVAASARALVEGVGGELARLRAGAPLRALGEGRVCDFCEVRGLCRRDHWQRRP